VRLETGDVVVSGGGGIYKLDSAMKETPIVSGAHVEQKGVWECS